MKYYFYFEYFCIFCRYECRFSDFQNINAFSVKFFKKKKQFKITKYL